MLPFSVQLKRGEPTHVQILAAVREALALGQLRDGDPFPSARELSQELRISPSVAQKVIGELRDNGFLAQQQGSGLIVRSSADSQTVVASPLGETQGIPSVAGFEAQIGQSIDSYEIKRLIAKGGMGMVFEALDRSLMRSVALKILATQFSSSEEARTRFVREARAAAAIDHEHVLPIHAVGEIDGLPYLVMPLVQGRSLRELLDDHGALDLKELLRIAIAIAKGLGAAHEAGLIHRDIKPDNVLVEDAPSGRIWIADFGLARAADDKGLTKTGDMAGTPQFASPEQVEGIEIDRRTDLFSFGSVLYMMATGEPPFDGDSIVAVLRRIVDREPIEPRHLRRELPADLNELIKALLTKNRADRPADATQIAERLQDIQNSLEQQD